MEDLARRILSALDRREQMAPITAAHPKFAVPQAYAVSDQLMRARIARGERVAGWKIGFTNRTIWNEYGVHAPGWGPMYASGIAEGDVGSELTIEASRFVEPRIEPEIVFRLARAPQPGMNDADLLGCIEAVGHGFEIVQSIYPGWKFAAADTVASGSLHGAFVCGPMVAIEPAEHSAWLGRLTTFSITLLRDGSPVDRGFAENVLDGPLSALRHFVDGLAQQPMSRTLESGDLITTGTVTRAFPVHAGEVWSSAVDGLPVAAPAVRFV